jgi:hypothetical protein
LLGVKAINMKSEYSAIFKHPGYPDYWGDHRFSGEYGWEQTENDHLTNETDWTQDAPDGYRVPITDDTEAWAATKIAQNRVNKNDWGINNALADTWFIQTEAQIPDYWKNDMFNPKKIWEYNDNPRFVNETDYVNDSPFRLPFNYNTERELEQYQ